jgi:uncharacterized protein YcbK (DUF882 family)
MSRLAPLVALVLVVLVAPRAFAQPAKPVAKPVTKAVTKAPPTSATTKPGTKTAAKTKKPPKNAPVLLVHINRHEEMPLRLRDGQGRPVKGLQRRFDRFLRCHHTNKQHAINPRLMRLLYQTGKHWPGKRLEVVSGYRHPTVAKNPRSPHMQGQACDFRVEGVKAAELRDYLRRAFEKVGVGYYPNSSFVHLDVRKDRSAFWIDYSGPGERAVYSANPNDDLRSGRADKYHPTKIDASWANEGEVGSVPGGGDEAGGSGSGEGSSANAAPAPAAAPEDNP